MKTIQIILNPHGRFLEAKNVPEGYKIEVWQENETRKEDHPKGMEKIFSE